MVRLWRLRLSTAAFCLTLEAFPKLQFWESNPEFILFLNLELLCRVDTKTTVDKKRQSA
jgi:hypothetical protein